MLLQDATTMQSHIHQYLTIKIAAAANITRLQSFQSL